MPSDSRLLIELDLDSVSFNRGMDRSIRTIRVFDNAVSNSNASLRRNQTQLRGALAIFRDFSISTFAIASSFRTLNDLTFRWANSILSVTGEFERMQTLLQGLSTADTIVGQQQEALEDFEFLINKAQEAPFALTALTDSFVKMRTVGIDPTAGAMQGLTDAIAAFGGDDQALKRATVAIQQMGGKGVVSMEELRQQLGEAVPTAVKSMARAIGVTTRELVDSISQGNVDSATATTALLNEFQRSYDGSAKALLETWSGLTSRLSTQWQVFVSRIGESGFADAAKDALQDLILAFDTTAVQNFSIAMGKFLTVMTNSTVAVVKFISENIEPLKDAITALSALFAVRAVVAIARWVGALSGVRAVMGPLLGISSGFLLVLSSLSASLNASAVASRGVGFGLARMKNGFAGLLALVKGLFTPFNIFVSILGVIAIAWRRFGDEGEKALEKLKKGYSLNAEEINQMKESLRGAAAQLRVYQRQAENRANGQNGIFNSDEQNAERLAAAIARRDNQAQKVLEFENSILTQTRRLRTQMAARLLSDIDGDFNERFRLLSSGFNREAELLQSELTDTSITHEEAAARRLELLKKNTADRIAIIQEQIDQVRLTPVDDGDVFALQGKSEAIATLNGRIEEANAHLEHQIELEETNNRILRERIVGEKLANEQAAARQKLGSFVTNLQNKLVGLNAEISDTDDEYTKFVNLVTDGRFAIDAEKLGTEEVESFKQTVKELSEQLFNQEKRVKALRATNSNLSTSASDLADAQERLQLAIGGNNGELSDLDKKILTIRNRYAGFRAEAEGMEEQLATLNREEAALIDVTRELAGQDGIGRLTDASAAMKEELASLASQFADANPAEEFLDLLSDPNLGLSEEQLGSEKVAALKIEVESLSKQIIDQRAANEALATTNQNLKSTYSEVANVQKELTKELLATEGGLSGVEVEVELIKRRFAEYRLEAEGLTGKIEELTEKELELIDATRQLSNVRGFAQLDGFVGDLESKLAELKRGTDDSGSALRDFVELLNDPNLGLTEEQLNSERVRSYIEIIKGLGLEIESATERNKALETTSKNLESSADSLAKKQNELQVAVLKGTNGFTDLDEQIRAISRQYDGYRAEAVGLTDELAQLDAEERKLIQTTKDLANVGGLNKLNEFAESLEQKLANAQRKVAGTASEYDEFLRLLSDPNLGLNEETLGSDKVENLRQKVLGLARDLKQTKDTADQNKAANRALERSTTDLARAKEALAISTMRGNDQFTALDEEILKIRNKFAKFRLETQGLTAETAALTQTENELIRVTRQIASVDGFNQIKAQVVDLKDKLADTSELRFMADLNEQIKRAGLTADLTAEQLEERKRTLIEFSRLSAEELARSSSSTLQRFLNDAQNLSDNLKGTISGFAGEFSTAIVDSLGGAEDAFDNLGESIIKTLAKIVIEASLAKAALAIFPQLSTQGTSSGLAQLGVQTIANAFSGISSPSSNLGSNSFRPPSTPLGFSGLENPTFKFVNNTGTPLGASVGEVGFDGKEFVVETVLTEASQPGPLRNVIGNG